MQRLSLATLDSVLPGVARPAYDPREVRIGILHLGLGAFHRAHQAEMVDSMLAREPQWAISGVSLKTSRAKDVLVPQDGLYTYLQKTADTTTARIIGSVREALFLRTDRAALMARFVDPAVRIVSLTVTEKGYCHDPASGKLDCQHADIQHDLAHLQSAISAPGILAAGLDARRAARAGPLTVLCCDNLPHNGRVVESIVHAFADALDPALFGWIRDNVTFPSTMVDRIVPATTPDNIEETARLIGLHDAAPVVCEPSFAWVMEDRFAAGRPAWEAAGVRFAADVGPYEVMKLRYLNASHSTLAYLGYLAGFEFIWQASADRDLAQLIERQMLEEVAPTVPSPPGMDAARYRDELLGRFRNPALPHRTQQIAMDGSQKVPQRLLNTVRERLASDASIAHLALSVAGWIRYASGIDEQGRAIVVSDPLAPRFREIVQAAANDPVRIAHGFLELGPVFGTDLPRQMRFRAAVTANVVSLFGNGVRATLAAHLGHRGADPGRV